MMVRKKQWKISKLNYKQSKYVAKCHRLSGTGIHFCIIFFEKFKCNELIYYIVEKARVKKRVLYDDDTLEEMKRYYKIENHDELLRFIKTHGLKNDDSEVEH
ncbi:MAG: hypothetical protein WBL54_06220 [Nitrososphaeraceae archaeon]